MQWSFPRASKIHPITIARRGTIPHPQNRIAVQNIQVKHSVVAVQNFSPAVVKQMFQLPLERVLHLHRETIIHCMSKQKNRACENIRVC
jgi:hypothetical protein